MIRKRISIAAAALLTGCAVSTVPVEPCCYEGEVTLAHVDDLYLEMRDGAHRSFQEVFPDYRPDTGVFTLSLPFPEADIALVTHRRLREALTTYDANGNGVAEPPEITILYVAEAARGLGFDVARVGTNPPAGALALAQSELGGMLRYVRARRGEMNEHGRAVFAEMEMLGRELRITRDGPDRDNDPRIFRTP